MTQIAIQKQIDAIVNATKRASQSKETARQFLIDAGIIRPTQEVKSKAKKK
jgi:hypothetical protein